MSKQKMISNMSQLAILELIMYVVYFTIHRESLRILSGQTDNTVSNKDATFFKKIALKHKKTEMEDILNIVEIISVRLRELGIQKTPSAIILQELRGNFLTLRRDDVKEELAKRFHDEALQEADNKIANFLKEMINEEKLHDKAITKAHNKLTGLSEIPHIIIPETEWREFSMYCFNIVFLGKDINSGADKFIGMVKVLQGGISDKDILVGLCQVAMCAYWSYCKSKTEG